VIAASISDYVRSNEEIVAWCAFAKTDKVQIGAAAELQRQQQLVQDIDMCSPYW
jgi:hypothetical protein